jgi:rhodanese-related sulfurtransferase
MSDIPNSISIDDFLSHRKANPDSIVIDVRDPEKFIEAHIPGAINIFKTEVESKIEETVPDKNAEIYCHCGGGESGPRAAKLLNEMGYKNAKYIMGGWRGYEAKLEGD